MRSAISRTESHGRKPGRSKLLCECGIAFVASLAFCRGENVGSSPACRPVDHHPDATFWLAVVFPAIVTTAVLAVRCPSGRWAWARFAPIAAWVIYLLVVIVSSPHG